MLNRPMWHPDLANAQLEAAISQTHRLVSTRQTDRGPGSAAERDGEATWFRRYFCLYVKCGSVCYTSTCFLGACIESVGFDSRCLAPALNPSQL